MFILLYITAFLNLALGLFVYSNNYRQIENVIFLIVTVFIFFWAITNAIFQTSTNIAVVESVTVLSYISATFLLISANYLSISLREKYAIRKIPKYYYIIDFLFLLVGVVSPLIPDFVYKSIDISTRTINTNYGFYFLVLSYLYFFIRSISSTVTNITSTAIGSVDRNKQITIGIGLLGSLITGTITNAILPAFNIYTAVAIGPSFTLILLSVVSFSIVRYGVFNIRLVLGRLIYYIILGSLPYALFYVLTIVYDITVGSVFDPIALLMGIPVSVFFIFVFNGLNNYLKKQVTTRFINPGYDPYEVVDTLGKQLATRLSINQITETTLQILKRTIRSRFEEFVVVPANNSTNVDELEKEKENNQQFLSTDSTHDRPIKFGDRIESLTDSRIDKILQFWEIASQETLVYDELTFSGNNRYRDLQNWVEPIVEIMQDANARVIVPVATSDEIYGMIVLGEKEADTPYTSQDVELLESIASTVALAVARSLFYEQVKDLNESLQKRVDLATKNLQKQNKDLEMAMERLEKLRQQERDMLDVMGHELRTPITIVRNALSVLQMSVERGQLQEDKLKDYIDKALESTKREITLIETLLAATKVDANRIQLNLEKVDMIDVVADSLEAHGHTAEERGLELTFDAPEDIEPFSAYADRVRIQEVSDNFVSNSIKYTTKGSVTIKVSTFKDENLGKQVKVDVIDTGIGIPPEDIPKLGRKFFRAKQYINKSEEGAVVRPGGTGLGLYVTFELIEIMGGKIEIKSELGVGSTFSFTVPKYEGQEPQHIDQTFNQDEEFDTKTTLEKSKSYLDLDQADKENEHEQDETNSDSDENTEGKNYKKVTNATDIIAQINKHTSTPEGN